MPASPLQSGIPGIGIHRSGTPVPDTREVVSVTVASRVNRVSEAQIVLRDGDLANAGFPISDADIFVPVSLNMMTLQHESFMNTYISQKDASFPSYELDGPFSLLAQRIQVRQYDNILTCLGRSYFYEHPSALMRATRGFVFLTSMNLQEFYGHTRELRRKTENR